jgi:hypothetical protein
MKGRKAMPTAMDLTPFLPSDKLKFISSIKIYKGNKWVVERLLIEQQSSYREGLAGIRALKTIG